MGLQDPLVYSSPGSCFGYPGESFYELLRTFHNLNRDNQLGNFLSITYLPNFLRFMFEKGSSPRNSNRLSGDKYTGVDYE
jgi:hypothetical protein